MNAQIPADYDIAQLKIPPYSLEAEQSVIGGLLVPGSDFDVVADLLTDDDFYSPAHRVLFAHIQALAHSGKPVDAVTVLESLSESDLQRVGGAVYLFDLARNTPSTANIRAYAAAVRERSNLRSLITIGGDIAGSAYDADGKTSADLIDEAQRMILAIGERTSEVGDIHVSVSLNDYIKELERRNGCDGLVGLSTGFLDFDKRTNGLTPGELVILAGRPGSGKTTLAMNIAEHVALHENKCVLVFSMEMTRTQLIDRMVASVGKIPFALLRSGKVFGTEFNSAVLPTANRIKNSKLYIDERGALTVQQMRTAARRLHKKVPLSLIVVDYLQLSRGKGENRVNEITAISQGLKALAKELNIPLIAISQLSRKCEEQKRRPISSDLRDSGAIEQDADSILLIYRDEIYNPDSSDKGKAEMHWTKLRNGQPGLDWLQSDLHLCRFNNLAAPYQSQIVEKKPERFEYS